MKCLSVPFTVCLFLLFGTSVHSQTTLRVMSYNLHGMTPGSDPATRLAHIIQNLKQIDPDILGVQEINESLSGGGADNQGKVIADSLSAYFGRTYYFYQSATHYAWSNTFLESIGIITKYPVEQTGYADLAVAEFPRKVVWNSIMTPLGRVNFFNTHLSNTSGATRLVQAGQILQYVHARELANPGAASILTGDFNDVPGSAPFQLLIGGDSDTTFSDTYADVNPGALGYTIPAGAPTSRIDFVFMLRSSQFTAGQSTVVMDQPYAPGTYCSDHYGMMTTFLLQTTPKISAPGSILFPTLLPGTQETIDVRISSASIIPLEISSITNHDPAFQVTGKPSFPVTLPTRGSAFTLGVVFNPAIASDVRDTIEIASNDPVDPVRRILLAGRAIASVEPAHAGVLYATSSGVSEGGFHTINPATGTTTSVGSLRIPVIHGLSIRLLTKELYGSQAGADSTLLYRINVATGDAIRSGVIRSGNIRAIGFAPGDTLYGASTAGGFYRIDLATGLATLIGTPTARKYAGISFNPSTGKFWACVSGEPDTTYEIDPSGGAVRQVGTTGYFALTRALAFGPGGKLYALLDNGQNVNYLSTLDTSNAAGGDAYETGVNSLTAIAIRTDSPTSVEGTTASGAPLSYALYQNYPNPFNPGTVIRYQLPADGHVVVRVFDLLGREVAVLVDGKQKGGAHELRFLGAGLSSGVYLCRMQAGDFVQTRKLILLH
jgi:endonuclease/exonuclease/phosphatase family metal-dependent hydrolase